MMQCGSKFKPLVVVQSYEDRDYSRVSTKSDSYGSSPVSEATERVSSPKQNGTTPSVCPPPPPPPPPFGDVPSKTVPPTTTVSRSPTEKQKPKQPPPVPIKYSTLSTTNRLPQKIGGQPPPSPIPDYDNLNFSSNTLTKTNSPIYAKPITKTSHSEQGSTPVNGSVSKTNGYGTLKSSPANGIVTPKLLLSNGDSLPNSFGSPPQCPPLPGAGGVSPETSTLRKRPVSVVIGEYPSDTLRRQPGKLDFLQNSLDEIDRSSQSSGDSISSQLASELAQTLNRSNLRRKTESVENLTCSRISSKSNGTVTISVGSNLLRNFARSTENLLDSRENKINSNSNRVTISIGPVKNSNFSNGLLKTGQ